MRAGESDNANARMDRSKPKAAQFQSFILIHSFLHAAVQCSNDPEPHESCAWSSAAP